MTQDVLDSVKNGEIYISAVKKCKKDKKAGEFLDALADVPAWKNDKKGLFKLVSDPQSELCALLKTDFVKEGDEVKGQALLDKIQRKAGYEVTWGKSARIDTLWNKLPFYRMKEKFGVEFNELDQELFNKNSEYISFFFGTKNKKVDLSNLDKEAVFLLSHMDTTIEQNEKSSAHFKQKLIEAKLREKMNNEGTVDNMENNVLDYLSYLFLFNLELLRKKFGINAVVVNAQSIDDLEEKKLKELEEAVRSFFLVGNQGDHSYSDITDFLNRLN